MHNTHEFGRCDAIDDDVRSHDDAAAAAEVRVFGMSVRLIGNAARGSLKTKHPTRRGSLACNGFEVVANFDQIESRARRKLNSHRSTA
jgi:hypothetical protein